MGLRKFLEKDEFADLVSVTAHSDDDSTITEYDEEEVIPISLAKNCSISTVSGYSTASSIGSDSVPWEEAAETPLIEIPSSNQPKRKKYIKQTSVPSDDQTNTASPTTSLAAEDRQALWLVWSTLQIHADAVQQLDEQAAVGRLMLTKLYKWNSRRMRECLQCPPEGRGGILADMARHILAYKMGNVCSNILYEVSQAHENHVSSKSLHRSFAHISIFSLLFETADCATRCVCYCP